LQTRAHTPGPTHRTSLPAVRAHWSPFTFFLFFLIDTPSTAIYTLSLHDALPISIAPPCSAPLSPALVTASLRRRPRPGRPTPARSEEHTSELQSRSDLVCRLLLEKKKTKSTTKRSRRPSTATTLARTRQTSHLLG